MLSPKSFFDDVSKYLTPVTNRLPQISVIATGLLAPVKIMLLNVYILVAVDLITGIWASLKHGNKFSSFRLRDTVSKLLTYTMAIVLIGLVEREFLPEMSILKLTAGYIALTEVTSLFENLYRITHMSLWKKMNQKLDLVIGNRPPRDRRKPKNQRKSRKG